MPVVPVSWDCPSCGERNAWWWSEVDVDMSQRERPARMQCEHCHYLATLYFDGREWRQDWHA